MRAFPCTAVASVTVSGPLATHTPPAGGAEIRVCLMRNYRAYQRHIERGWGCYAADAA